MNKIGSCLLTIALLSPFAIGGVALSRHIENRRAINKAAYEEDSMEQHRALYKSGMNARKAGLSSEVCPHKLGTVERRVWTEGYVFEALSEKDLK